MKKGRLGKFQKEDYRIQNTAYIKYFLKKKLNKYFSSFLNMLNLKYMLIFLMLKILKNMKILKEQKNTA